MLDVRRRSWILAGILTIAVISLPGHKHNVVAAYEDVLKTNRATGQAGAAQDADKLRPASVTGTPPAPDPGSLQTIGTLTAAHYFQTYLNIGFIADGKGNGTYTSEDARKVLRSVLSLVDSVDRQLETFGKRTLDRADRDTLEQMQAVSALLRRSGTELQRYWESGQDQDAAHFESLRKTSYAAISKLIAIGP